MDKPDRAVTIIKAEACILWPFFRGDCVPFEMCSINSTTRMVSSPAAAAAAAAAAARAAIPQYREELERETEPSASAPQSRCAVPHLQIIARDVQRRRSVRWFPGDECSKTWETHRSSDESLKLTPGSEISKWAKN